MQCPTLPDLAAQVLALLPRGRAWQSHSGDAMLGDSPAAEYGDTGLGGSLGAGLEGGERLTRLQGYWWAYAALLAFLHQRACALLEEMFCATTRELAAEWGDDYGYPDDCEPFATLCERVAWEGGTSCAYFEALAARIGFTVVCTDTCNNFLADFTPMNFAPVGGGTPNRIHIVVTALPSGGVSGFVANLMIMNYTPPCPPGLEALACLMDRFKPAHCAVTYEVELA